jgi:hypothetical protein
MSSGEMHLGFIMAIMTWGILSLIVAYVAGQRGRGPSEFFFLSLIISPLLAFLILIALPIKNPDEEKKVKCPHCHGLIDQNVECCMHCRRDIVWAVTRMDFPKPEVIVQPPEPAKFAEFEGTIIECLKCRKMYSQHGNDHSLYPPCTHCGTPNPLKKQGLPIVPTFEAECPDCGKAFPIQSNLGIVETLCPHCQSILKLDTAMAVAG